MASGDIYAAYRGEEYIGEGTITELAGVLGIKQSTLRWYTMPAARKRMAAIDAGHKHRKKWGVRLVLLERHKRRARNTARNAQDCAGRTKMENVGKC